MICIIKQKIIKKLFIFLKIKNNLCKIPILRYLIEYNIYNEKPHIEKYEVCLHYF